MKKCILLLMLLISQVSLMFSQNDTTLYIANQPGSMLLCLNHYQRVYVYAQEGCNTFYWTVDGVSHTENPVIIETATENNFYIVYYGGSCGLIHEFGIGFAEPIIINSYTKLLWKHQGSPMIIEPMEGDSINWGWDCQWNTGETTTTIEVNNPGVYEVTFNTGCITATRTFIVRDNVEIYRAGVDPATNKNKVRWNTTPEQAQYISSIKVERDGMVVGTAPYLDGEFLDNIGSENAARIYKITAIDTDGNECPLPSYQFGTFNTIISPDIANPSLMNFTWEDPFIEEGSPYSVVAYRIGRFNETTGEFTMIDQLSANVHLGKYNMDLFGGDYGIVAAVFNDAKNRNYEELAFSNRSDSGIVGISELENDNFKVYPNPTNGVFTVEGTGILHITNALGQTIQTKEIDGKTIVELPQGMYFVQLNGVARKIVVE